MHHDGGGGGAPARAEAAPGDTVLLAPAAASFDQYDNFEQRGDDFYPTGDRRGTKITLHARPCVYFGTIKQIFIFDWMAFGTCILATYLDMDNSEWNGAWIGAGFCGADRDS